MSVTEHCPRFVNYDLTLPSEEDTPVPVKDWQPNYFGNPVDEPLDFQEDYYGGDSL